MERKVIGFFQNKRLVIVSSVGLIIVIFACFFAYMRYYQVLPDVTSHFLAEAKIPQKDQIMIVFSPHQDDETLGTGGLIYKADKDGAKVYVVLVTDGNKHGLKEKRLEEFKTATKTLGVPENNLFFLNHPDGKLKEENTEQVYLQFKKIVDELKPDFVVYPNMSDTHPDHAQTGKIVDKVLKDENYSGISEQYLIHYPRFPQPKKYDIDRNLMPPIKLINFDNQWQQVKLDNEAMDEKTRAIFTYKTQLKNPFLHGLMLSFVRQNELISIAQ